MPSYSPLWRKHLFFFFFYIQRQHSTAQKCPRPSLNVAPTIPWRASWEPGQQGQASPCCQPFCRRDRSLGWFKELNVHDYFLYYDPQPSVTPHQDCFEKNPTAAGDLQPLVLSPGCSARHLPRDRQQPHFLWLQTLHKLPPSRPRHSWQQDCPGKNGLCLS